jgi:DNA-binding transcriptional ArsR family regulator
MTKYWNERRLRRARDRKRKATAQASEKNRIARERGRSYSTGNHEKNAGLMLDALGLPLRRKIVMRSKKGGAMSLSKLVEPFNITLPTALVHLRTLERAGILTSHKRGRIRFCVYNRWAIAELSVWLAR